MPCPLSDNVSTFQRFAAIAFAGRIATLADVGSSGSATSAIACSSRSAAPLVSGRASVPEVICPIVADLRLRRIDSVSGRRLACSHASSGKVGSGSTGRAWVASRRSRWAQSFTPTGTTCSATPAASSSSPPATTNGVAALLGQLDRGRATADRDSALPRVSKSKSETKVERMRLNSGDRTASDSNESSDRGAQVPPPAMARSRLGSWVAWPR